MQARELERNMRKSPGTHGCSLFLFLVCLRSKYWIQDLFFRLLVGVVSIYHSSIHSVYLSADVVKQAPYHHLSVHTTPYSPSPSSARRQCRECKDSKNTVGHEIPQMPVLHADWRPRPADGGRLRVGLGRLGPALGVDWAAGLSDGRC